MLLARSTEEQIASLCVLLGIPKIAPPADNALARALRSYQLLEWYMTLDGELDAAKIGVERGETACSSGRYLRMNMAEAAEERAPRDIDP